MTHPSLPTPERYFMSFAQNAKSLGNCLRIQVGCAVTRTEGGKETLVGVGYNTSPDEDCSCLHVGCMLNDKGRCTRTIHAEVNASNDAKKAYPNGKFRVYVTISPCVPCLEHMKDTLGNIERIYVLHPYRPSESREWCKAQGVDLVELDEEIQPKINAVTAEEGKHDSR